MIPGTRPARRSARAAPLPARERAAALIRLTVAMMVSSSKTLFDKGNSAPSLQGCCSSRGRRAYSGAECEKQGMRARRRLAQTPGFPPATPGAAGSLRRGRIPRNAGLGERRLQGGDAGLERFVFLTRQAGHILDRLEILALDHVEVAHE